jgi:hypothetical protein
MKPPDPSSSLCQTHGALGELLPHTRNERHLPSIRSGPQQSANPVARVRKEGRSFKKFGGDLGQRIKWTGPKLREQITSESDQEYARYQRRIQKRISKESTRVLSEQARKLALLAEHYDVSSDDPRLFIPMLLLHVCKDFIPGFQVESGGAKRGRKILWDFQRRMELMADVDMIKDEKTCGDRQACRILIDRALKTGKGRYLPTKRVSAANISTGGAKKRAIRSLETRLFEARRHMVTSFAFLPARVDLKRRRGEGFVQFYRTTEMRN